jgi:hypothetical protein
VAARLDRRVAHNAITQRTRLTRDRRDYEVLDLGRSAARSHPRRPGYRADIMRGWSVSILPDPGWATRPSAGVDMRPLLRRSGASVWGVRWAVSVRVAVLVDGTVRGWLRTFGSHG